MKTILSEELAKKAGTGMIAPEYDPKSFTRVGDYVVHDGKLYWCNYAATGAWNENRFTEVDPYYARANYDNRIVSRDYDRNPSIVFSLVGVTGYGLSRVAKLEWGITAVGTFSYSCCYNSSSQKYDPGSMTCAYSQSVTLALPIQFDCMSDEVFAGNAKYVWFGGFGVGTSQSRYIYGNSNLMEYFDGLPVLDVSSVSHGESESQSYTVYTVNGIAVKKRALELYPELSNTGSVSIKICEKPAPGALFYPLEATFCGKTFTAVLCDVSDYSGYQLTRKIVATTDQLPKNSHDADKVTSPDGSTVVKSNNDGTATISSPGSSGALDAPVLTFSDDFNMPDTFAGTTTKFKGPFTFDGWTMYLPETEEDPTSRNDAMSGLKIVDPATGGNFVMLWYDGSDFAQVTNLDTTSPSINIYTESVHGTVTAVRNYAPVTKTLATLDDIQEALGTVASALDVINGEVL